MQNQPDFQAGAVDHRTHFVRDVPRIVRQAMEEYCALTGREYAPIKTYMCDDAETVMVGLGSVTDDVAGGRGLSARARARRSACISIKLLQPFPEAEVVAALERQEGRHRARALGRQTALTTFVTQALFKARENADGVRHPGIPAIDNAAQAHHGDLRPRRATTCSRAT